MSLIIPSDNLHPISSSSKSNVLVPSLSWSNGAVGETWPRQGWRFRHHHSHHLPNQQFQSLSWSNGDCSSPVKQPGCNSCSESGTPLLSSSGSSESGTPVVVVVNVIEFGRLESLTHDTLDPKPLGTIRRHRRPGRCRHRLCHHSNSSDEEICTVILV